MDEDVCLSYMIMATGRRPVDVFPWDPFQYFVSRERHDLHYYLSISSLLILPELFHVIRVFNVIQIRLVGYDRHNRTLLF